MKYLIILLLSVSFAYGQEVNLNTSGEGMVRYRQPLIKVHRVDSINTANTDWNCIKFDTLIGEETTFNFSFNADSTGVIYTGEQPVILRLQGCLHCAWNGAGGTAEVLGRVTVDGVEARCSQANWKRSNQTGDNFKLDVIGTIYVTHNQLICMQYKVSSTSLDFEGVSGFDSPVAASINFEYIGQK